MADTPSGQVKALFDFVLSLPAFDAEQRQMVLAMSEFKASLGTSGIVKPSQITEEDINAAAAEVAGIADKSARTAAISELIGMFCFLARDAVWVASWALEAEKTIQIFPERLKVLTSVGAQIIDANRPESDGGHK